MGASTKYRKYVESDSTNEILRALALRIATDIDAFEVEEEREAAQKAEREAALKAAEEGGASPPDAEPAPTPAPAEAEETPKSQKTRKPGAKAASSKK